MTLVFALLSTVCFNYAIQLKTPEFAMKKTTSISFSACFLLAALFPLAAAALDTPDPGTSYSYPLPAKAGGLLYLAYTMAGPGTMQAQAYNEAGELVLRFSETKPQGLQSSPVDLCCLPPGVYLYLITLQYDTGKVERLKPAKFVVVR